ncbi:MAG: hypothetical protein UY35_C0039G0002 [Candidatus Saccharibacteria bacterium GW2011_GWC2_48_9]|nr:MAG: hypothetical protein UY35_C0039G0002 [Candidatus Saccharibacteria bacterium GW2011_GWC2_48_9]
MNIFKINTEIKELLNTGIFIVILLVVYKLFPTINLFQEIVALLVFFVAMPILYVKFILKKNVKYFGFEIGDKKNGLLWSSVSLVVSLLLMYIVINYTEFLQNYSFSVYVAESFKSFLLYELFAVSLILLIYEFFFRGFIVSQYGDKFSYWVILFQWFLFILLVASQGFSWQFIPFIVFSPFSAFILLKSRSLLYGFVSQIIFMIIIDASVIALLK